MKRILIMSVCLLISGAAIYGFVDYLKTDKKQLDNLYKEEDTSPVVKKEMKQEVAPVVAVRKDDIKDADVKEKRSTVKKNARLEKYPGEEIFIKVEDFSRGRPVRKKDVKAVAVDTAVVVTEEIKKEHQ
jgi:hypothetical protein